MEIRTPRLLLRPFAPGDASDACRYLSDPEVVRFEPYPPFGPAACRREVARRAMDPAFVAVERLEDGRVIGNLFFERREFDAFELGYVFARDCWGRGYASESARALMADAFVRRGAHRIFAECDPRNAASWRLMERLGMRREARFEQNIYFIRDEQGEPLWQDTLVYAVLAEEWRRAQC